MWSVAALIAGRCGAQWWLEWLNSNHASKTAKDVPEEIRDGVDETTRAKSVAYTLAKSRFARVESAFSALLLVLVLFTGVLAWWREVFVAWSSEGIWASALFVFLTMSSLSVASWPLDWWFQFRLEERYGFNNMTPRLWWIDRGKGLLLFLLLAVPLLALILAVVRSAGAWWWCWAWACVCAFQFLLILVAPRFILPWFNKFSPLPDGSLKRRLLELGRRTGFHARNILVMDGSRRSTHSNAFFTGLGKFRQIVLFDTLLAQLSEVQLESVLAHEIGHYQKGHIPKMLAGSAAGLLAGFFVLSLVMEQPSFYEVFGFAAPDRAIGVFLMILLAGVVAYWIQPLTHHFSRRWEYEADAYAAGVMGETDSLRGALRILNLKNLSNLTPHPAYSRFYYSHPTLAERERALQERC